MKKRELRIIKPIQSFLENESTGGLVLIFSMFLAMFLANSGFSYQYFHILHSHVNLTIGEVISIDKPLEFWINDFLMAIFFFLIGLEIKREIMAGELSSFSQASLPISAAIGGMVLPAFIYFLFNRSGAGVDGWGIPMATDIAFSLGILSLLGKRVPISLKIFLTALAIVDDLGAVLVIAIFYTSDISVIHLVSGLGVFFFLFFLNYLRVYKLTFYIVGGIALWYLIYMSGIHATIAGVLLALTIPAKRRVASKEIFVERVRLYIHEFHFSRQTEKKFFLTDEQSHRVDNIQSACKEISSPLQRLEHTLHPYVSFFIMPLFALANAGIKLEGNIIDALSSNIALGVMAGLFFGKQFGILLFTWIGVKLKLGKLPSDLGWPHIYGLGALAGVGFTMSLFIAHLAFHDAESLQLAKIGILVISIISSIFGVLVLINSKPKKS